MIFAFPFTGSSSFYSPCRDEDSLIVSFLSFLAAIFSSADLFISALSREAREERKLSLLIYPISLSLSRESMLYLTLLLKSNLIERGGINER